MKVENGVIVDPGINTGGDNRPQDVDLMETRWWQGGHGVVPLEWCLAVNGFSELADGFGYEDHLFGITLFNRGFPLYYDSRMKIIEDRTPGEIDGALKRANKGVAPNDKGAAIVSMFGVWSDSEGVPAIDSKNPFNIRQMRSSVLEGNPFPPPTSPDRDWFDNQLISEME